MAICNSPCQHVRRQHAWLLLAGLVAFIAQAKYDNPILEIVTFASAIVLVTRVVLGYKRMYDRYAITLCPLACVKCRRQSTSDIRSNVSPVTSYRPDLCLKTQLAWTVHG